MWHWCCWSVAHWCLGCPFTLVTPLYRIYWHSGLEPRWLHSYIVRNSNPYTTTENYLPLSCFFGFLTQFLCVKPYVPREPQRDPSNRRLCEHGIYIWHCQESNSQPVLSQAEPIPLGHSDGHGSDPHSPIPIQIPFPWSYHDLTLMILYQHHSHMDPPQPHSHGPTTNWLPKSSINTTIHALTPHDPHHSS